MHTEPRHRRRAVTIAAIALALVIALPVALQRPEAASEPLATRAVSADATEAHSRQYHDIDPWAGMEQALAIHEQQKQAYIEWAVEQERLRQEAIAAEKARRAAAAKAAAAAAAKPRQAAAPTGSKAAAPAPSGDVWHRLAMCETGGKMDNPNTGNGYYGYFQFSKGTWDSVGGTGYPHEHSYGTQLAFAQKLQARSGWGQWPACSRKLGLR